jgi:hypothetical protein
MEIEAITGFDLPLLTLVPTWSKTILLTTTTETESSPLILAGVLLSLVAVYLASKIGGELANSFGLPPVLGELVGGVVVGVSALDSFGVP